MENLYRVFILNGVIRRLSVICLVKVSCGICHYVVRSSVLEEVCCHLRFLSYLVYHILLVLGGSLFYLASVFCHFMSSYLSYFHRPLNRPLTNALE
jgi:hypothetical protein